MSKIQSLIEKLWNGTISPEEITILENALKNVNDEDSLINEIKNLTPKVKKLCRKNIKIYTSSLQDPTEMIVNEIQNAG